VSGGDGSYVVGNPALPDGPGIPDRRAELLAGPDFAAAAEFMEGKVTGCGACGFTGGECFTQDPSTCPSARMVARERFTAKAEDVAQTVATIAPPVEPADEGGVWVTYVEDELSNPGDSMRHHVTIHRTEIDALRRAVQFAERVDFLGWGESL
jgi:hypothetical protein